MKWSYMSKTTAENLEAKFDAGEDVLDYFDVEHGRRPGLEKGRINLDLPKWLIDKLEWHARKAGVARQALVKVWMAERIAKEEASEEAPGQLPA